MNLIVTPDGTARWGARTMRCALGRAGIATAKREGDGATPAGTFPFRRVLYRADRLAPPQTALPAQPIGPADGWCDDPADPLYNRPVTLPYAARHERMWREDHLYDLVVVLGHNDDPVRPGAGSAVFLHVAAPGYGPTAGCVGLAPDDLLRVVREARPSDGIAVQPGPPVAARPTIRLLHHLARTGGTLISRCLGSMDGVVLLSEINPQGLAVFDPLIQAHQWFGLLTAEDTAMLERRGGLPFLDGMALIERRCAERGKLLVLRDWTHLDFTGVPYVRRLTYDLSLARVLQQRFRVVSAATVRHAVDQWRSLRQAQVQREQLRLDAFLHGYRRFAEKAAAIGFVRYEDFLDEPQAQMRQLCAMLALPYDGGFIDRWSRYDFVTGDRVGSGRDRIGPRRPTQAPREVLDRFAANADYRRAIALLGYAHPA
jgi:L,D-peptidoglycan transpeptidase YkuD (ErfK/YbiS/YcfS/YnhG family)